MTPEMRDLRQREAAEGKRWIGSPAIACALTHRDQLLAAAETDNVILCGDNAGVSEDFIAACQIESVRRMFSDCGAIVLVPCRAITPIIAATHAAPGGT